MKAFAISTKPVKSFLYYTDNFEYLIPQWVIKADLKEEIVEVVCDWYENKLYLIDIKNKIHIKEIE